MLAEVLLALARHMPRAGFLDSLVLSDLTLPPSPPWRACRGFNPPPSIESKTVVFTIFFAVQGL